MTDPLYEAQTATYWYQEYLGDLLHRRDSLRQDLYALRTARWTDGNALQAHRCEVLAQINRLNKALGYPEDVLDAETEHGKAMVKAGLVPEFVRRAERAMAETPLKPPKKENPGHGHHHSLGHAVPAAWQRAGRQ